MNTQSLNSKIRQQLGDNVRESIKRQELSQRQLGALAKERAKKHGGRIVNQSTIGRVAAEVTSPTVDVLDSMARTLGTRAWQLLFPGRAACADVSAAALDKWVAAYLNANPEDRKVMDRLISGLNV